MFDSFRANNTLMSAQIQTRTQTYVNGVPQPVTWTTSQTEDCLFWVGGSSQGLFSEKIRAEVTAVCAFDPDDVSSIADDSRIVVYNGAAEVGTYSVIHADNVGMQGKIMIVALKEFK